MAWRIVTDSEVNTIRSRRAAGERGAELAREFGISQQALCDIVKGRTWKHLRVFPQPARVPMAPFCVVAGCRLPSHKRSMCSSHYRRTLRGSPMYGRKQIKRTPIADRLWSNVRKGRGCWEWTGFLNAKGYGQMTLDPGGSSVVHRVSWRLVRGAIPRGLCVLHRCDNRKCVRPSHLFLGTNRDNTADMVAKRRQARGERQARARLTAEQVISIRRRRRAGERTQAIADDLGVAFMTVYSAAVGLTWKHLPSPQAKAIRRN